MSSEVMAIVLRAGIDNAAKKAVLIGLAEHAHPDGSNAYPTVARLAIYTSLGEATVREKLAELRDEGLIQVTGEARQHAATCYQVNTHRLREMVHPRILAMDERKGSTARYGGQNQTSSSRRPGVQTSSKPRSDLQISQPDLQMSAPDLQEPDPNLLTLNPNRQKEPNGFFVCPSCGALVHDDHRGTPVETDCRMHRGVRAPGAELAKEDTYG